MSRVKISRAQREQLSFMAGSDVMDITDESIVKALQRRGYAERYVPQLGPYSGKHMWRITDAGRAVLREDSHGR